MAKDKRIGPANADNVVTIVHENDGDGIVAGPEFSEGYNGPDVTIRIDESYTGGKPVVPEDQKDHVYAEVGKEVAGGYVPLGSNTALVLNCAGPG